MSTERFTVAEFEEVLNKACQGDEDEDYTLELRKRGIQAGEYRYQIVAHNTGHGLVFVEIASSIGPSGIADDTGENSIRLWLTGEDGMPMGNKISRWVTRVKNWQDRLFDQLDRLISMAQAIRWCDKCLSLEKVFIVKKEGPNKGRLFIKCNCPNSFDWLEETDQEDEPKLVKANEKAPYCPKCGGKMVKRNGKRGPFYGCSLYPACNGTRDIEDVKSDQEAERDMKQAFAKREVEQERKAFESDPDMVRMAQEDKRAALLSKLAKTDVQPVAQPKPAGKKFTPTPQQLAIFNWVQQNVLKKTGKSLVVNAGPGCGKTRTGIECTFLIPSSYKVVMTAFNTHIAAELQEKAPKHVRCCTLNSLGFAACRKAFGNSITVDEYKTTRILETVLDKYTHKHLYPAILQLVSLCKAKLSGTTVAELTEIADYHGIELNGDADTVFAAVAIVLEQDIAMTGVVDYDDQVFLPVYYNLPCEKFDAILGDELQDFNNANAALIMQSLKPTGSFIGIGDTNQSLYGFRGANVDAIENVVKMLDAEQLPLSVTFRCPKSHVRHCNEHRPDIPLAAADWAIEGTLRFDVTEERALMEYKSGDMVICRTNAPLVAPAFALIRKGIKATIRGRDIGKGLTVLIRKLKAHDLFDLMRKLEEYSEVEVAKLMAAERSAQAQTLQDKVETIIALSDGVSTISELEDRIETIFSDKAEGVVFSSIHRAKGLEAKNVYILHPELIPHPMAKKEWEQRQEGNCWWVSRTRSLENLTIVLSER